jgi:formiminoglutamase
MENIIRFSAQSLYELTSFRKGEIKFGERIVTIPENIAIEEYLKTSEEPFVLLGIPEDIGVKANLGRIGTASAWENTLKSLVNIQHNRFAKGYNILLLGTLDTSSQMEKAKKLNPEVKEELKELYKLVEEIDKEVTHIISSIVAAGKIPIHQRNRSREGRKHQLY